mmetsp:Transcript_34089/g.71779  ORF Transcript_34089/g.71779 Transcript_34089/m.71779 type:complete len:337 (-) Transcript_34089:329-1339(-)
MTMRRAARMLCCLLVHSASAAPVSMVASGVLSAMIMPDRIAWHVRRWHADGAARVRSQRRILDVSRSCATANAAATSTKHLGKLILVRHGESTWNMDNKFTGWADVPLTDAGRAGLSKRESGCDDFELFQYRMTLAGRPPAMQPDHPYFTRREAKYVSGELLFVDPEPLALADVPLTESLADTCNRCRPVWEKELEPMIRNGVNVLVVGHANQLRALIQCVQQISDERQLMTLGVPNTMPLVYTFEHDGTPVSEVETGCFVSPLRGHYLGSECLEFNEIDTDGSGAVDATEFRAAGFCDNDDECEALMDVADNNGDKLVDFKEFMAWEAKGRPKSR